MGNIVNMWKGANNTYWCLIQYWIGAGYQYAERETTKDAYDLWLC